jgi:Ca2+-binding EF-hand superfamily protein
MLKELFDTYDTNGNGKIEYKEFISILFGTARVQVTETKTVRQEVQETKSGKNHKEFSKTKK